MTSPAAAPDVRDFAHSADVFRRELLAHCYRMLGSVDDAEDVLQDTYLRAWRSYGTFQGRSSLRAWLYRIATNTCLTQLTSRRRRVLPSGLGPPADDPLAEPVAADAGVVWIQPIPDSLVEMDSNDPAAIVTLRESLRLALIASLQYLPPRQRAVLLLRDVLGFPAAEVAEMLDTTTAAVKSTLQRARARIDEVAATPETLTTPTEPEQRRLLHRYIAAFENADSLALEQLLRRDATLEATPLRTWLAGQDGCLPYLVGHVLGASGDWRMSATRANGQPAAVAHRRNGQGTHRPYGVVVLTMASDGIAQIQAFGDPGLVHRFHHPG